MHYNEAAPSNILLHHLATSNVSVPYVYKVQAQLLSCLAGVKVGHLQNDQDSLKMLLREIKVRTGS